MACHGHLEQEELVNGDREHTERALASIERNAEAQMELIEGLFDRLAQRHGSAERPDVG
jgi:hypothetical protein